PRYVDHSPLAPSLSLYSAVPPTLHAFPTRRSSDLTRIDDEVLPEHFRGPDIEPVREVADVGGAEEACGHEQNSVTLPAPVRYPRSEEHTSELQSRFDLVCRLLLEKKHQDQNVRA